jgi:hypothetical protein
MIDEYFLMNLVNSLCKIEGGLILGVAARHPHAVRVWKNGSTYLARVRLRAGWFANILPPIHALYGYQPLPWPHDAGDDIVIDVLERGRCFADTPGEAAHSITICGDPKMREAWDRSQGGGEGLVEIPREKFPKPRPQKVYKATPRKKDYEELTVEILRKAVKDKRVPPGSLRIHATADGDLAAGLGNLRFGALEGAGIKYGAPMTGRELRTLVDIKAFILGFGLTTLIGSAAACRAFAAGKMNIIPAVARENKSKKKR